MGGNTGDSNAYLGGDEFGERGLAHIPTNEVGVENIIVTTQFSSVSTFGPLTLGGHVHRNFGLWSFLGVVMLVPGEGGDSNGNLSGHKGYRGTLAFINVQEKKNRHAVANRPWGEGYVC